MAEIQNRQNCQRRQDCVTVLLTVNAVAGGSLARAFFAERLPITSSSAATTYPANNNVGLKSHFEFSSLNAFFSQTRVLTTETPPTCFKATVQGNRDSLPTSFPCLDCSSRMEYVSRHLPLHILLPQLRDPWKLLHSLVILLSGWPAKYFLSPPAGAVDL